ncbi:MAG: hypothetical protein K6T85_12570 [Gorillibacterium sp.]|nr:hypothetical protein [Gorillibacterium sp.]
MRAINFDTGNLLIDEDNEVLDRLTGVQPGDFEQLDISAIRPTMDELSKLYRKAQATKLPQDGDAYRRHKERVIAMAERRDIHGERYE